MGKVCCFLSSAVLGAFLMFLAIKANEVQKEVINKEPDKKPA